MPRTSTLSLEQFNKQIDLIDQLRKQLTNLQHKVDNVGFQTAISDPNHAPQTTNNLVFTWTGGAQTISWAAGWLKDKNWQAQIIGTAPISSAPGTPHIYAVPAGTTSGIASTYYWVGWNPAHSKMLFTTDASTLHANKNVLTVCQIFTGTVGQTGPVGGGGANGGTDFSGTRYKLF